MDDTEFLGEQFEQHRRHLRAVAYRMLGSLSDADDAVQEAWLRLSRADAERGREPRRLADDRRRAGMPGHAALAQDARARSRSTSACPIPSSTIDGGRPRARGAAGRLGRARAAGRAGDAGPRRAAGVRAARHVRRAVRRDRADRRAHAGGGPSAGEPRAAAGPGRATVPDATDRARQREVVDAFHAAASDGDFERLLAVLHPDAVLRVDWGPDRPIHVREGADAIAGQAVMFSRSPGASDRIEPVLVNGLPGDLRFRGGRPFSVLAFTVVDGRIAAVDILADVERLARLVGAETSSPEPGGRY